MCPNFNYLFPDDKLLISWISFEIWAISAPIPDKSCYLFISRVMNQTKFVLANIDGTAVPMTWEQYLEFLEETK